MPTEIDTRKTAIALAGAMNRSVTALVPVRGHSMPRLSMHVLRRSESILSMGGTLLVLTTRLGLHGRRACGEQRLHRLPALGGCGFQGCTPVQFLPPFLPSADCRWSGPEHGAVTDAEIAKALHMLNSATIRCRRYSLYRSAEMVARGDQWEGSCTQPPVDCSIIMPLLYCSSS
jgi:hypothetical protein